jgi:enoyl-CoA hydratase/carnithine racemase
MTARSTARIGDSYAEYGLVPAVRASVRLPEAIAGAFARHLLLTGERISGIAARKGLAAIAVERKALDEEADQGMARVRGPSKGTLQIMKAMLPTGQAEANRPQVRRELGLFLQLAVHGLDKRAGLEAFHNGIAASFDDAPNSIPSSNGQRQP